MAITRTSTKLQLTLAILALGISSQVSAASLFTVDPNTAFGAIGGPHQGPFQADSLIGTSSTLISLNADHIHQHGEGWVTFPSFVYNSSGVSAAVSGLNVNWQMWGEFSYTLALTSGTYAGANSTYAVTDMHQEWWVDPSIGTPTILSPATGGAAATVTHGDDSFQIANADALQGVVDTNSLGGSGLNSTNTFELTPQGTSLFTAPFPFYNLQFVGFNNTSSGIFVTNDRVTVNQSAGIFDFAAPIPEPEIYTMLVAGLGFLGWRLRHA